MQPLRQREDTAFVCGPYVDRAQLNGVGPVCVNVDVDGIVKSKGVRQHQKATLSAHKSMQFRKSPIARLQLKVVYA